MATMQGTADGTVASPSRETTLASFVGFFSMLDDLGSVASRTDPRDMFSSVGSFSVYSMLVDPQRAPAERTCGDRLTAAGL